jgi:hypothetical protein
VELVDAGLAASEGRLGPAAFEFLDPFLGAHEGES